MKIIPLLAGLALAATLPSQSETFAYYHENVLGTSMELRVSADSESTAIAAEATVLAEVDRLSAVLSTWQSQSEISRWQATNDSTRISPDLAAVLLACDTWRENTHGAFHAGVAAASNVWKNAEKLQTPPSASSLAKVRSSEIPTSWTLSEDRQSATFLAKPGEITVDGLAKGYIIDQAIERASASESVRGLMLNIGGDLRITGDLDEPVAISHPLHPGENAAPHSVVRLKNSAIATSGNDRRGWDIAGRHYSHILDPRNAQPVDHVLSASVVAPDATMADALATAFNVLSPAESLQLAARTPGVQCLILTSDGREHQSGGWQALAQSAQMTVAATDAKPMELSVNFELNTPDARRYHRPYVAIWIEDKDGRPVRTLLLWILKGQKGLKWLPDLKRWSKADKMRRLGDPTDLVPTVSTSTRNPGSYSVVWDGLDDQKKPVPAGEYTLFIEVNREKGTYQLMKHAITVGGAPFKANLEGNVEVKTAVLDYHPKAETH